MLVCMCVCVLAGVECLVFLKWLCLLMSCSVRTPISMKFFPRFFLLYFLVFHIYFFSYGYGMVLSLSALVHVSSGNSYSSFKILLG